MTRPSLRNPGAAKRRYTERREANRAETLAVCSELGTIGPAIPPIPWSIGVLMGLERDGLLRRLPERDRLGDERFEITAAGRAAAPGAR